ncbi:YlaN family protein [Bacillaceae bacterium Marseille-Q3522]|nr:YlaN family protein [Bacillaceae bacterium Marseille-Q3522]
MTSEMLINHKEKARALLKADADKILKLIKVQMDNLTMPQCPLYEDVLDTQMFGLSREIDFAVRLGLIAGHDGKLLLDKLERELSALHEASVNNSSKKNSNRSR